MALKQVGSWRNSDSSGASTAFKIQNWVVISLSLVSPCHFMQWLTQCLPAILGSGGLDVILGEGKLTGSCCLGSLINAQCFKDILIFLFIPRNVDLTHMTM
jgi:hypothetical protein